MSLLGQPIGARLAAVEVSTLRTAAAEVHRCVGFGCGIAGLPRSGVGGWTGGLDTRLGGVFVLRGCGGPGHLDRAEDPTARVPEEDAGPRGAGAAQFAREGERLVEQ
ncbi:hypothetical protein ACFZC5_05235 [Nocardia gamkensis]|uniref:hypothetical protein n=1 Tax=Nocardia gamkensis TaxID=352869 RepID=UPI0036EA4992